MKKVKKISLLVLKIFSAFCFAYVVTLIGREFLAYGLFSFVFLLASIGLAFFYLVRPYSFLVVLLIDAGLVLFALLLRFYVVVSYGS